MNFHLKAVFVATLGLALASCGSDEGDETATGEVISESQTGQQAASSVIEYSAANYENGISFGDISMGDPNAPVTIIEYASLTCGHCANFHNNILPEIKRDYIDTGKAKLVFRNFLLNQQDLYASMIARCTTPEKSYALMSLFFSRQSTWIGPDYINKLAGLARRAGMSRASVDTCMGNSGLQQHLIEMQAYGAEEDNVTGTPTFFIEGTVVDGAKRDDIIAAIEDAL